MQLRQKHSNRTYVTLNAVLTRGLPKKLRPDPPCLCPRWSLGLVVRCSGTTWRSMGRGNLRLKPRFSPFIVFAYHGRSRTEHTTTQLYTLFLQKWKQSEKLCRGKQSDVTYREQTSSYLCCIAGEEVGATVNCCSILRCSSCARCRHATHFTHCLTTVTLAFRTNRLGWC